MFVRRAAQRVRGFFKRGSEQKAHRDSFAEAVAPIIEAIERRALLSATSYDIGEAVVTLDDGSIVVGGTSQDANVLTQPQITLARYTADGVLQTFNVLDITGFIYEMAVDGAGRIVAAGTVGSEFAVLRFNPDLTLDATFGGQDGIATAFESGSFARDLVVQPDGRIVVVGHAFNEQLFTLDIGVARFEENGDVDVTFGSNGTATADMGAVTGAFASMEGGEAVALDNADRIVVAATVPLAAGDNGFGLARFTSTGTLDPTFGLNGSGLTFTEVTPGSDLHGDQVADVQVLPDGTIVVAGTAYYQSQANLDSVALVRYDENGALDGTFGSGFMDGDTVIIPAGSGISIHLLDTAPLDDGLPLRAEAKSLAVFENRLVVAATVTQTNGVVAGETEVGLFGFTLDGYRDLTFGEDGDLHPGIYMYDHGDLSMRDWFDDVRGMAVTATQILVVGVTSNASPFDFLLVQFGLDGTPGGGGVNLPPAGNAGGPYVVDEGASLLLTASGLDPEDGANVTYHWDLDDDGIFEAEGQSVSFAPGVSGPATLARNVRITDSANQSFVATAHISVTNVAPSATIDPVSGPLVEGVGVMMTGSATDAGAQDVLSFHWSIAGPSQTASGSGSNFHFVPADDGQYTVTLTVSDGDGGVDVEVLTLSVANAAPVVDAGPNAAGIEGTPVSVTMLGVSDVPADTITGVSWNVIRGMDVVAEGMGWTASFLPVDNDTYIVTFTATDEDGGAGSDSLDVVVANANPVAALARDDADAAVRQWEVKLTGSFTDAGAADTHTVAWQVSDAAGTLVASGSGTNVRFTPVSSGMHTITLTVTDDDGGVGTAAVTVSVVSAAVVNGVLRVGGTSAADHVVLEPTASGNVRVLFNGASAGAFAPAAGGNIVRAGRASDAVTVATGLGHQTSVYGGAGADTLRSGKIGDMLFGEGGNDSLLGNAGSDILVGGDGNDLLVGGKGDDLLIGGHGEDSLVGNQNDDVIVAGWTRHDEDPIVLGAILKTWRMRADYKSGAASLAVAGLLLEDVDVFDDGARDVMTGEGGRDLFYGNFSKPGVLDVITDLKASEFTEDLDLITPLET